MGLAIYSKCTWDSSWQARFALLTLTITWPQDAGLVNEEFKVAAQVNRDVRKTLFKAQSKKSSYHRMIRSANMQILVAHDEYSLIAYCQVFSLT